MSTDDQLLSPIDASWYQLDRQGRMLDIGALLLFEERLDLKELKGLVEERLVWRAPFRSRVVESVLGRPHWELDEGFRLDAHVHHLAVPGSGDDKALAGLVGELMSAPLDLGRPLWELYLLDRKEGSAILARVHHCIGDGFSLGNLLLSLGNPEQGQGSEDRPESAPAKSDRSGKGGWLGHLKELSLHPGQAVDEALLGARAAQALGRLVMLPFDTPSRLDRQLSHVRRAAWSDVVALSRVKEIGKRFDATVNDTLLTALTGALRAYLLDAGEPVEELRMRAIVPVNLREARFLEEMPDELGNHFGLVFVDLPVDEVEPLERLFRLKREIDRLKETPEAVVSFGILQALGHTPAFFEHLVEDVFVKKASLVASNVPGPRKPLFFAGRRLKDVLFWNPHPGRLGLGMSIMSYVGRVRIGIRSDAAIVEEPARLAESFHREFDRLEAGLDE